MRFGDIAIGQGRRSVWVKATPVRLTQSQFEILRLLAMAGGETVSLHPIRERLYQGQASRGEKIVGVHIMQLGQRIAAAGGGDPIKTIRARGYALEPDPSQTSSGVL